MDLYKPYYVLIWEFFPKATLIPDKFHIVPQIRNTFDYKLSNEGTNNIIKQLKHNACGYRKFSHLKARVILVENIYNPLVA